MSVKTFFLNRNEFKIVSNLELTELRVLTQFFGLSKNSPVPF